MTSFIPEPDWAPFAAEIRQRLTRTLNAKDSRYGYETVLVAPEDLDEATREDGDLPPVEAEAGTRSGVTGSYPDGEAEPAPAHRLSVRQLQLTLRLAATFKDSAGVMRLLTPGGVILVTGMTPPELGTLADLLWLGFLPPGCQVGRKPERRRSRNCDLLLIASDCDGDETRTDGTRIACASRFARLVILGVVALLVGVLISTEM